MKKYRFLFFILTVVFFVFAGCSDSVTDEPESYYVSYVSRMGTVPEPILLKAGTVLSVEHLKPLNCTGYTFNGWYNGGTKVRPGAYTLTKNLVLTALWKGNDCTVKFTHTDNVSGNSYTKVYETGTEITVPESPYVSKKGLNFKGWLCNGIYYQPGLLYTVKGDELFTAYYAESGTHTISYYNVCDGNLVTDNSVFLDSLTLTGMENPQSFTESETVFISGLKKTGYTFGGWYKEPDCTSENKAQTFWTASEVKNDLVLYAKWSTNVYTILFDGNSGILKDAGDPQSTMTKSYKEVVTLPECKFEFPGYDFVAWSLEQYSFDNEFIENQTVSMEQICSDLSGSTITFYAHWRGSTAPYAPQSFSLTGVDKNQVSLKWKNAVSSNLAYTRLSYREKNSSVFKFIDFPAEEYAPGADCSYTVMNLNVGTTYYFNITSYDISGNANNYDSTCTLIAVPRPAPYIPKVSLSQNTTSSLDVSWELPLASDYPLIESVEVYVNGECKKTLTGNNGSGDCYAINKCSLTVYPREIYTVSVRIKETLDDSGRYNETETTESLLTQPEENISIATVKNADESVTSYYSYAQGVKFKFSVPQAFSFDVNAEYVPIDSDGNELLPFTFIQKLTYEDATGLYLLSSLEPETSYRIKFYVSVEKDLGAEKYKSYSYLLAKETSCITASKRAACGYFCYSDSGAIYYYHDVQPAGYSGTLLGVVCAVDSYGEPKVIMSCEDEKDDTVPYIAPDYQTALSRAKDCTKGGLSWSLPSKETMETLFNSEQLSIVFDSIHKANGTAGEFSPSTIDEFGRLSGRYVTSSTAQDGTVYVFDMDGMQCGAAVPVISDGSACTFRIRLFAML